jgi:hypothetical protein
MKRSYFLGVNLLLWIAISSIFLQFGGFSMKKVDRSINRMEHAQTFIK